MTTSRLRSAIELVLLLTSLGVGLACLVVAAVLILFKAGPT